MSRHPWVLFLACSLAGFAVPARADLIVSIQDSAVSTGSVGTVNVWLTSTATAQSPDLINGYAIQIQITNNGASNTQLAFAANQDFDYIDNPGLNPPYLLLGDSFAAQPPPSRIGGPTQTVYPGDTFIGADSTFSGDPLSLSSGFTYLLAKLTVTTLTGAPPENGDTFTVGLAPDSGSGSLFDNPNTYFNNFDYDIGNQLSATPFSSRSGTVQILNVVPGPSSALCLLVGLNTLGAFHACFWKGGEALRA